MPRPDNPLYTILKTTIKRETIIDGKAWIVYLAPTDEQSHPTAIGMRLKHTNKNNIVWFPLNDYATTALGILENRKALRRREE